MRGRRGSSPIRPIHRSVSRLETNRTNRRRSIGTGGSSADRRPRARFCRRLSARRPARTAGGRIRTPQPHRRRRPMRRHLPDVNLPRRRSVRPTASAKPNACRAQGPRTAGTAQLRRLRQGDCSCDRRRPARECSSMAVSRGRRRRPSGNWPAGRIGSASRAMATSPRNGALPSPPHQRANR